MRFEVICPAWAVESLTTPFELIQLCSFLRQPVTAALFSFVKYSAGSRTCGGTQPMPHDSFLFVDTPIHADSMEVPGKKQVCYASEVRVGIPPVGHLDVVDGDCSELIAGMMLSAPPALQLEYSPPHFKNQSQFYLC